MDVNDFFEDLNEKTWRSNISGLTRARLNEFLEILEDNKDNIVDSITTHISEMESLKLEESEEFNYNSFKKWLDYYLLEVAEDIWEKENSK